MPGARLTLVVALAVASVGVAPGRAGADGPDVAVIEATAEADFTAGRYQEALRGFERLYRLQPRAETLFAIARCHQELGQCARAAEVFEDFLATDPDAAARRAAAERMASCVAAAPPPVEAPPVEAPPPGPRVRTTPSVEAAPARSRRGLVLGLAGGGVAVGLVAATLELLGRGALTDSTAAAGRGDAAGRDAAYDRASGYHYGAQAGAVVAVAAVATAGALWWTRPRRGTQVAVVPTGAGGLVTWGERF